MSTPFAVSGEIKIAKSLNSTTERTFTMTVSACDIRDCGRTQYVYIPVTGKTICLPSPDKKQLYCCLREQQYVYIPVTVKTICLPSPDRKHLYRCLREEPLSQRTGERRRQQIRFMHHLGCSRSHVRLHFNQIYFTYSISSTYNQNHSM